MSHFQSPSLPLIITTVMHIGNRCAMHSSLLLLLTFASPFLMYTTICRDQGHP
jgi:hypothetical protein